MEQKDYKIEIIKELLKNNKHIRKIAKNLHINHMTIQRKTKELEKENVVDYKQEGKNKVYFLKKTLETKNYLIKTEAYKINKIISKYPVLRNIIEKIQKNKKVKLAILFGSYAKERAKNRSDIDIYVETLNNELKKEIEIINSKINVKIGKFDFDSLLIKEIIKNNIIIKGMEEYYERTKIFS